MSVLLLAVVLVWVGRSAGRALLAAGQGRAYRLVLYAATGLVVLHLLLMGLDLAGIRWTRWSLLLGLLAVGGVAEAVRRRSGGREGRAVGEAGGLPSDLGWGDAVAAGALGVFALFAPTLWVTTPDWAYHWGLKAHRYFLAGGVDLDLLTPPWNWTLHPDYPNLLPDLHAATAVLAGRFDAPELMLWSVVFMGLLLAAARELLRQAEVDRTARQATTALLGLVLGSFALRGLVAGGADVPVGLALLLALPALLGSSGPAAERQLDRSDPAAERQLGLGAALAAGSKIEGVVLAAALVGVLWLLRGRRLTLGVLWRSAALPAAVVLPWLLTALRHDLFVDYDAGGPSFRRLPAVASALGEVLLVPELAGFSALVWLPLPLLLSRRARAFAAVASLQLAFYLYVYLSAAADHLFYVTTTLPRLALHLVPAAVVAAAAALWGERPSPAAWRRQEPHGGEGEGERRGGAAGEEGAGAVEELDRQVAGRDGGAGGAGG